MKRFLDPRTDLVFKRIFGQDKDILKEFLNSVLPFEKEEEFIAELEYLTSEMIPEVPLVQKNSLVDVRCMDKNGRQFIVEMQLQWTRGFLDRALFNASKAYVRQLQPGEEFETICPVYGLSIVDDTFAQWNDDDDYYHDFRMIEEGKAHHELRGLRLIFIELPKFHENHPRKARQLRWAWLKFLKEAGKAGNQGQPTAEEFEKNVGVTAGLREAFRIAEQCGFSRKDLAYYDRFWDAVSTARTLEEGKQREWMEIGLEKGIAQGVAQGVIQGIAEGMEKGIAQGMEKGIAQGIEKGIAQGIEKGIEKGLEKGREEEALRVAANLKSQGVDPMVIVAATGLTPEKIACL